MIIVVVLSLILTFAMFRIVTRVNLVGTGPRRRDSQRLWELDWLRLSSAASASSDGSALAASSTSSFDQWHHRLGHLCGSRLSTLICRGLRIDFRS